MANQATCDLCGDPIPAQFNRSHNKRSCCPECYLEVTDGTLTSAETEPPRAKRPDNLGGDRNYHGDTFQSGEW